jgi:hypothetical protein
MKTKFNLIDIVKLIETTSNTKARLDNKFGLEYLIPNVSEQNLIDAGFEFKEKSSFNVCPIYQRANILAHFDESILHVYEL